MLKYEDIKNYCLSTGISEEQIEVLASSSVYLAFLIMRYAHRGQKREDGEDYEEHPMDCMDHFRKLSHFKQYGEPNVYHLLIECGIPYEGVQELCFLHDVLEDTEVTIEDIRGVFKERHFIEYFDLFVLEPLQIITHNKKVDYDLYIKMCMENPTSAFVKMLDLQDNLNIFTLNSLDAYKYERAQKYLKYIYMINSKYHFIENYRQYEKKIERKEIIEL